jgi:N-hydroxyarylamine O-acetyltransferase
VPTLKTLRDLHAAHVYAIPFENLDILLGRGIDLDLESLQAKLVGRRRGGYCFEHNILFAAALERIGLAVTRLAARVRLRAQGIRPRTHTALRVEVEGRPWLADVGFGGGGLVEPVALEEDAGVTRGGWTHGLVREGDRWVLRALESDGWTDVYELTLEGQHFVDYVMANHFTATYPGSPFTRGLVVQRTWPSERLMLRGGELAREMPGGSRSTREVEPGELPELLVERFGIPLSDAELGALQATLR